MAQKDLSRSEAVDMEELEEKFVAPKNGINDEATDADGAEQQDLTLVVADESENGIAQFDAKLKETYSSTHNNNNALPNPLNKGESRVYDRTFLITLRDESKFVAAYAWMGKELRGLKAIPPSSRARCGHVTFEKLPISRYLMKFDEALDKDDRLNGLWDSGTLTDQSVTKPNYSAVCALMCKELAKMQVSVSVSKAGEQESNLNFRKLIITRCQIEFQKNIVDKRAIATKIKEIEDCPDPGDKEKQSLHTLKEKEKRIRFKCVSNIRFIGELFKQRMLVTNIVHRCVRHLLTQIDEESLECLCKLLSRIGKALESKSQSLDGYFIQILEIVNRKGPGKVSSRARSMLQDVVELRLNKWVPRRAFPPFKKHHSRSSGTTILYKLPSFPKRRARA